MLQELILIGAKEFLNNIPKTDAIIFVTSRTKEYKEMTEQFFQEHNISYQAIIYGLPYGERILVNDRKPSGLPVSFAVNTDRDKFMDVVFEVDENL